MMNKIRDEKGFTLVELLIVIAILAVLAVAAAPKFIAYKLQADANTCRNNQSTIETALEQIMFQDGAYPASGATDALVGAGNPLKVEPACPGGGDYAWDDEAIVSCSFAPSGDNPTHERAEEEEAPAT